MTTTTTISLQNRIAGAVLGGAIGDALGAPVEFMGLDQIRRRYGPRGLEELPTEPAAEGRQVAKYTDDTQLAEIVLRSTLESLRGGEALDPAMRRLAALFVHWKDQPQGGHRAPGGACTAGCRRLAEGVKWSEAGGPDAGGCGSVMRAWPIGLLLSDDPARAEEWAVAQSRLTHNAPLALAACAAVARGTASLVRGESPEHATAEMIAAARRWDETTAAMVERAADEASTGVEPEVVFDRLRAWAAHEAIAAAVYLLLRHPDDYRAAALEGANTPGDSDSIASIAGALVGARIGIEGLPAGWVRDVERSAELLALAQETHRWVATGR